MPSQTLKSRLKVIANAAHHGKQSSLAVVYIGATRDKLVPRKSWAEFKKAYAEVTYMEVDGPHFILQAQPEASAAAIINAFRLLTDQPDKKKFT